MQTPGSLGWSQLGHDTADAHRPISSHEHVREAQLSATLLMGQVWYLLSAKSVSVSEVRLAILRNDRRNNHRLNDRTVAFDHDQGRLYLH